MLSEFFKGPAKRLGVTKAETPEFFRSVINSTDLELHEARKRFSQAQAEHRATAARAAGGDEQARAAIPKAVKRMKDAQDLVRSLEAADAGAREGLQRAELAELAAKHERDRGDAQRLVAEMIEFEDAALAKIGEALVAMSKAADRARSVSDLARQPLNGPLDGHRWQALFAAMNERLVDHHAIATRLGLPVDPPGRDRFRAVALQRDRDFYRMSTANMVLQALDKNHEAAKARLEAPTPISPNAA